jgi:transcription elongation factor Elf1
MKLKTKTWEVHMTSIDELGQLTCTARCIRCGQELTNPVLVERVNTDEVRQLFSCSNCDYEFEMVIRTDGKQPLPAELAEEFLPNLMVA